MTNLRTEAIKMALETLELLDKRGGLGLDVHEYIRTKIEALRQALAQPEQNYEVTHNDNGTFSVALPDGDELRIIPPKREWVGLEDEDVANVKNEFNRGALWAEAKLKEKNA